MNHNTKFTLDFEKPLEMLHAQLESLRLSAQGDDPLIEKEISEMEKRVDAIKKEIYAHLSPWQRVQLARHPERPYTLDYFSRIFNDFQELHGDRLFGDDGAIVGGLAFLDEEPVMLIGQQKGRSTKEKIQRNFGSPHPEGYRKALRLMKMAENFQVPLISFIDTAGAYPGIGSEERHVAEAIAVNIREMSSLKVPIVAVIIGEGGSGGALGTGVGDSILILENAYYSTISPEGCAAILWKDRAFAPQAAEALKITAQELLKMGIVDTIVAEPLGGAHRDCDTTAQTLKQALVKALKELKAVKEQDLLEKRYQKYRAMGSFIEAK
jgi:acetyl-CoA carboxylase carboxyl transferase subunit alpha